MAFGRALSPAEVEDTIQGLVREKAVALSDTDEVIYAP
jgi:hypothetical protein